LKLISLSKQNKNISIRLLQIMVRNTTGGTGTKSLARKHQTSSRSEALRLPECDLEQFACVTKMLGNGMCEIYTNDNVRLIAHIRNSFSGKNKRHNLITNYSIVMVGLYEWEKVPKNCNIMLIYNENQIQQIESIPSIDISHILQLQLRGLNRESGNKKVVKDFEFNEEEEREEIAPQRVPDEITNFIIEETAEVDIDDI